ncbi:MAG: FAD-binding oxidoreductase [Hyphomicrobiales bacterium]|nr:FAD-binding oxidoreductase [Hyphomicrobiales bacterium]
MAQAEKVPRKTIAVVGAGIVGVSAALWLQRDGHDVVLVDRAGPGEGTSYGNGGVLASCSVVPVTVPSLIFNAPKMILDPKSPLFLNWSYLPRMMPWLMRYLSHCRPAETARIASALAGVVSDSLSEHQALSGGTRAERHLVPSDYLFIYRDRAAFEADSFGWGLRKRHGFTWREMGRSELETYDPIYGEECGFAVALGDHGHITDPGAYVADLAAEFVDKGGRLINADVTDVARENGQVTALATSAGPVACDAAVIATGVWSKPLARKLGISVPLESERGYHVELMEPSIMPKAPAMIAAGKFVVTPMEGRIRLAGIVEFGGLDAPPSKRPIDLLLSHVQKALPGLKWAETRDWLGHRPAPSDSIPLIGPVPGVAGAYLAFGHHHIGLTAGPRTGRLIADMISGRTANIDLAPYRPERFS